MSTKIYTMKKFLYFILAIIVLLVIAMFAWGKDYEYEKSMTINAPAEKIYSHINSMQSFNEWNPWMKLDPKMKVEYSGASGELGDRYCWDSTLDDAGAGCQEITGLEQNKKMLTKINFSKPFPGEAFSEIILEPAGNATKVTWNMKTEMGYPMNLMKPFMDNEMEKSYTEGLTNLKTLSEK